MKMFFVLLLAASVSASAQELPLRFKDFWLGMTRQQVDSVLATTGWTAGSAGNTEDYLFISIEPAADSLAVLYEYEQYGEVQTDRLRDVYIQYVTDSVSYISASSAKYSQEYYILLGGWMGRISAALESRYGKSVFEAKDIEKVVGKALAGKPQTIEKWELGKSRKIKHSGQTVEMIVAAHKNEELDCSIAFTHTRLNEKGAEIARRRYEEESKMKNVKSKF